MLAVEVKLTGPDGDVENKTINKQVPWKIVTFEIENPQLWWPNGYGEQPLYHVEVLVKNQDTLLDSKDYQYRSSDD